MGPKTPPQLKCKLKFSNSVNMLCILMTFWKFIILKYFPLFIIIVIVSANYQRKLEQFKTCEIISKSAGYRFRFALFRRDWDVGDHEEAESRRKPLQVRPSLELRTLDRDWCGGGGNISISVDFRPMLAFTWEWLLVQGWRIYNFSKN